MAAETRLLIDGDVIAFIAASACQNILEDDFGFVYPFANRAEGEALVENILWGLKTGLKADSIRVVLSDPEANWRTAVDPKYKTNREGLQRPLLLAILKQYLRDEHGAFHWPSLEADDTLGILATEPQSSARNIVVGRDKDFKSIPGLHHQWKDLSPTGEMIVREISQWEADRWHLIQTLGGDPVDGYGGCPGIGMTRAARIIDKPVRLVPAEGVKTRGVNKGESVTKWMAEPTTDLWTCIVSHYRKAGLTEADALRNARLARILRWDEYDQAKRRLTLWTPDRLTAVGVSLPFEQFSGGGVS